MENDHSNILELLHKTPIIAAVKDNAGLEKSLGSDASVVFLLYGSVLSIPHLVEKVREAGKLPIVHIDLLDGLAPREASVDYICNATRAAGIISTKPLLTKRAHEKGMFAIRRFFLLDSMAMSAIEQQLSPNTADLVEVLPGAMPKVLARLRHISPLPFIAGGLISDKEDVLQALSAGAIAVSATNPDIWYL